MIDSHCHLDHVDRPVPDVVADAEAAGVTRLLSIGMDGSSCRATLQIAEDYPQVFVAIGRHPNSATDFDDADASELAALAAHERCVAIGETGLDYYRDYAPRPDQERAFDAQIELARETGKPLVIHTRAAEDDTIATLTARAEGLTVVLHCFSMPDRLDECLEQPDWVFSFAGNVTYPKAPELREAAKRVPGDRLLVETDAPYLAPQPMRGKRNEPRFVVETARLVAEERGETYEELERRVEENAARVFGVVGAEPRQPTLRRLRQFDVRPDRSLGQNFLIDSNILGVIERAAELHPQDVVLEIGGGLGTLSEHLAARAGHVHVSELDRRLEPALHDALDPFDNTTLHLGDAMDLDLRALEPAPTKVVANLPYGVAATVILKSLEELDHATRWVAMVQKEVGERFAAKPATPAYGVPSVLAQLSADVKVIRPVSRAVFHPVPNVDSVLLGLDRTGPAPPPALRALVQQAFAHRRKALARSLSLAPGAPKSIRDDARAALEGIGHPADERAERLSPEEFRALGEALAA